MQEFIINFHYLIIGITVFLFIAIIGYFKENKGLKELSLQNKDKEDVSISAVSISDLENSTDTLNV